VDLTYLLGSATQTVESGKSGEKCVLQSHVAILQISTGLNCDGAALLTCDRACWGGGGSFIFYWQRKDKFSILDWDLKAATAGLTHCSGIRDVNLFLATKRCNM